jgi:hypothetical protein
VQRLNTPRIRQRLQASARPGCGEVVAPKRVPFAMKSSLGGWSSGQGGGIRLISGRLVERAPGIGRGEREASREGPWRGRARMRGVSSQGTTNEMWWQGVSAPGPQKLKPHWRASNGKHFFALRRVGFGSRGRPFPPWLEHARRGGEIRLLVRGGDIGWSWIDRHWLRSRKNWATHGQESCWFWPARERRRALESLISWGCWRTPDVSRRPGCFWEQVIPHSMEDTVLKRPKFGGERLRAMVSPDPMVLERGRRQQPVVGEGV